MASHQILSIFLATASMALAFINSGCNSMDSLASPVHKTQYENFNALLHANTLLGEDKEKTYLKAHLNDGGIILYTNDWLIDSTRNVVVGEAQCYDVNRRRTYSGITETKADDVTLFETNSLNASRVGALKKNKVMFLVTAAAAFVCIADPKVCFGSCPTFYLEDEPESVFSSDAEGFSSAIHPSLEYIDCDGLGTQQVVDQSVSLTMKNEALETHCIDAISLVAIPLQEGERIYHNPQNDFWRCRGNQTPAKAVSGNSEVSALLSSSDLNEYHRWTDQGNMLETEEVYMTFPGIPNTDQYGLVLDFRQSLMSTYLFYEALSYAGPLNSDYYVEFGNRDIAKAGWKPAVFEELGGIEVSVWDHSKKQWKEVGIVDETGPIAINTQMLTIGKVDGEVKVRLRMTRGAWRIDAAQLVQAVEKLDITEWTNAPRSIQNQQASKKELYIDPLHFEADNEYFISMPGESYTLGFDVSGDAELHELFLFSEGHYIEWMRGEWLQPTNRKKIRQMRFFPRQYLKQESAKFQEYEEEMERMFWESKVTTPIFTDYAH
jgi:hypothetical protein